VRDSVDRDEELKVELLIKFLLCKLKSTQLLCISAIPAIFVFLIIIAFHNATAPILQEFDSQKGWVAHAEAFASVENFLTQLVLIKLLVCHFIIDF
jgi:hypothetical protein